MRGILFTLTLLLLMAACGDAPAPQAAAERDVTRDPIADGSAAVRDSAPVGRQAAVPTAAEGWTVDPSTRHQPGDSMATLRSVRSASREGFDRVVFDFGDGPLPGFRIAYVAAPQHQCGSGHEVRLEGAAWLSIMLQPAQAHNDAGEATVRERSRTPDLPNLLELRLTCDFEGQVEWVAGLRTRGGYRLLLLQQPNRLTLDIKH